MILDHRGQPYSPPGEPQSARLSQLFHEFATHPSRGLTPGKLARILEDAEHGKLSAQCDLFDDMEEKDGHIFAEMDKRKRAILQLDWSIEPPSKANRAERRAAAMVHEILEGFMDLDRVLYDMTDAYGKGFAALEIEWHRSATLWHPKRIVLHPQRWFTVDPQDRNTLRLRDNSINGAPLVPLGWIVHCHRARSGYIGRIGLLRTLAWPYLFKNYAVRDLAEFLEIYGLPLRLGKYQPGASAEEKSTLLRAVVGIGHDAAGIIPDGMKIEFMQAASGNKDPFEYMISWCERTQSKAILGGTLTSQTDSGRGAFALGKVHLQIFRDLVVSDARQIQSTLSRDLVWPLLMLNQSAVREPHRAPRFRFAIRDAGNLKAYADALPKLLEVGLPISEDWLRAKINIPVPKAGDRLLGRNDGVTDNSDRIAK